MSPPAARASITLRRVAVALLVWGAAWLAMLRLDGRVDLANLAMVLVLASALATVWVPIGLSLLLTAASVLTFNWLFVPPRHTFSVDLRQDALLLGAMLGVSWIVAGVTARQRVLAESARLHAHRADQLRMLGEALRDADDPAEGGERLRAALADLLGAPACLLLLRGTLPAHDDPGQALVIGAPTPDQRSGLWQCVRQAQPFGPGTGRHAERAEWYLPMRGRQRALGAAVVPVSGSAAADDAVRAQAQALCDQMGQLLQRTQSQRTAEEARSQAQAEGLRNTLLAAISHDYRTPLAAMMGAATSLRDQAEQLQPEQRLRLAQAIVDEARQLGRIADNTLQLARLGAPGVRLHLDWESAEDIAGSVLQRARPSEGESRLQLRLEPGLPLVRGDAVLLSQLLENLVDNALKYSPPGTPIELDVRRLDGHIVFAVRDRGPGIDPAWHQRIFQAFERGETAARGADGEARRGAGVGLALCRAIARAHGGELKLRSRAHGGTSFECWLPERMPPHVEAGQVASGGAP
jgi:two-component system sensor histidine kinase KdpD